ncbi:RHS repeat protein [Pseudonocardiaceae bacterium YIM PH 21723]|nr:RHS repeat protein [Pseudonocardiaceae bacterium YIM PH 21723]
MFSKSRARRGMPAKRFLALLLTASFLATSGGEAIAAPKPEPRKLSVQKIKPVPGHDAAAVNKQPPAWKPPAALPKPVWPAAGSAIVDLGGNDRSAVGMKRAGSLPVSVDLLAAPELRAAAPEQAKVKIEILDRKQDRAFDQAVLLKVTREDKADAELPLRLSVDTDKFRTAGNADWARRLRLISLPDCALTSPNDTKCAGEPLATEADRDRVSAPVTVPGKQKSAVVALAAGPSGDAGSYAATSLSASSSWTSGGSAGDFNWSYPLRLPPALGGPAPTLKLDYSSSSVDGRTSAANNQPSWIGEGFEMAPGHIERSYASCSEDKDKPGANNKTKTGDLCWAVDNATMNLGGSTVELVRDDATGNFRPRKEDGSKVEHITSGEFGDHWKVTTINGTQYFFGRGKLPKRGDDTNSRWTVPVAGNHAGEPCYKATFADSFCDQPWRWNLDYVVDPQGNTMSYWYAKETNKYAKNADTDKLTEYVRGGYLDHLDYGTRNSDESLAAPLRVQFETGDRCAANCDPEKKENWKNWPDTPWDQRCTVKPCLTGAPTFWTARRLAKVTTKVRNGDGYTDVESWTLKHSWPSAGDKGTQGMWLDTISHSGKAGSGTELKDVRFVPQSLDNRVDPAGPDHAPPLSWMRMQQIFTETGGVITVKYLDRECAAGTKVPTQPESNGLRCYPVKWTPPGWTEPKLDYFHKYPVASVHESDLATSSPTMTTSYEYPEPPAWHYTDEDGLIGKDARNWSKWRGYGKVIARKGDGAVTENVYFRGMDGDKLPSGNRSVEVQGVKDAEALAGMARETITKDARTGAEISGTVNDPWLSNPTAKRTINGMTVEARYAATSTVRSRFALDGNRGVRKTKTTTDYGDFGLATKVWDFGDEDSADDDQCTVTSYARNDGAWMMSFPNRVQTFAVACDKQTTNDADVIGDGRTYYDGKNFGEAPDRGNVTKLEALKSFKDGKPEYYTASRAGYDEYGRVKESWDVKDKRSTTDYTPASGAPVTKTVSRNPLGHETTVELDPAWGQAVRATDSNGLTATHGYDGLGRLTGVWLPGRSTSGDPSIRYEYDLRNDAASAVVTSTLNPAGQFITSYQLFDGLLRPRQTQAAAPGEDGGKRILTDTLYDATGRPFKTNGKYTALGDPGRALFLPANTDTKIPDQVLTEFDGAGRPAASIQRSELRELWRSTTAYGGDRTYVTPPQGGTPTTTITDGRGRTVEMRQHTGSAKPEGAYQATTYGYTRKNQLASVTDPAGNTWKYTYDLAGQQIKVEDPDKGVATSVYNAFNELESKTDARGNTIAFDYDDLGRPKASYDGRIGGTKRTETVYDEVRKGQPNRTTRFSGGQAYVNEITGYDNGYRPTDVKITIPAVEKSLAGTYTFSSSYKVDGSPAATLQPAAGGLEREALGYEYDKLGLPTTFKGKSSYVIESKYTNLAEPGVVSFAEKTNGVSAQVGYSYDESTRRLIGTAVYTDSANAKVSNTDYSYDQAGNVTRIADVPETGSAADVQCFQYDRLRQLTEAWTPNADDCGKAPAQNALGGPGPYWQSFTYDTVGNRKTKIDRTSSTSVTSTTTYPNPGAARPHAASSVEVNDGAKKVTSAFAYNETGELATRPNGANNQTLEWDAEGKVSKIKEGSAESTFVYDAGGNRLIRRDATGWTLYLPGMELKTGPGGANAKGTRFYSYNGSVIAQRTAEGVTWLANDHQGTAKVSIEAKGDQKTTLRRQDPFGVARGDRSNWPNSHGFVGGDQDSTGLTHLGAREYDPAMGRFISVDPVFDAMLPQQMNAYSYSGNNPITHSDPTGTYWDNEYHEEIDWSKFPDASGGGTAEDGYWGRLPAGTEYHAPAYQPPPVAKPAPKKACGTWDLSCKTKSAWKATANFVENHKAQIAGIAVGLVAGVGCGAVLGVTGVGVVACGAFAGAVAGAVEQLVDSGGKVSWDTAKAALTGAAVGGITAGLGSIAGAGLKAGAAAIMAKTGGKEVAKAASKAVAQEARALADVGKNCVINSFASSTPVLMADGSHRQIADIKPGDKVLATDPETGKSEAREVVAAIVGEGDRSMVDITVDTGSDRGTIVATDGHPIWVANRGAWVKAGELTPGDQVLTPSGELLNVLSLKAYTALRKVHNLTIDQVHTFSVQAAGKDVITHNCGETFYRSLSAEHYQVLKDTGRVSGTTETSISSLRSFSENYDGVLVQFTTKPGTRAGLERMGVRDKSPLTARLYPDMAISRPGWGKRFARFKHERSPENQDNITIALGTGRALDFFNDSITSFQRLR